MPVTEVTRRNIMDALTIEKVDWAGRLSEPDFLSRIWNLREMPSRDHRFQDAYGDIWQHRIRGVTWTATISIGCSTEGR